LEIYRCLISGNNVGFSYKDKSNVAIDG